MFRSNPLGFVLTVLFLGAVGMAWYLSEDAMVGNKLAVAFVYLSFASLCGFWMWRHGLQYSRLIDDIPTSQIVSAPQGYVELVGVASAASDTSLVTSTLGQTCLWYRTEIAERARTRSSQGLFSLISYVVYVPIETDESRGHFSIKDETGVATIFPYQAEIICADKQVSYQGDTRYTEERILPGETLYVLGSFSTHTPAEVPVDLLNETQAQISVWQTDKKEMLRRFDKDGDDLLDMDEWEAMHNAAHASAQQAHEIVLVEPQVHSITNPGHGLRYLISTRSPQALAGHYRLWRNLGLILFFGAGTAAVWLSGLLWV